MNPCVTFALGLLAATHVPEALAQDKDTEKLFRDMEKKIKSARAIEVGFTYQLEGKTAKGSLLLTNDNKARLRVSGHYFFGVKGNPSFELVSDGKRMKTKGGKLGIATIGRAFIEPGGQTEGDIGKAFHDLLAVTLSRGGIGPAVLGLPYLIGATGDIDPDSRDSTMAVRDFKASAGEKIGERQTKVVTYRHGKGGNDDAEITLWIDAENGLPLKRVLFLPKGEKLRITDAYSEFKLNPNIDAKAFALPK